ncbi:MAG TPA: hypothetical protein VLJ39_10600 [Tepidisphaeraceae bacterium]|nr:hypothetical protein [Tepidisphaeraceae bacterium]
MESNCIAENENERIERVTLDYASPEANRPDWGARLIISLLLIFLAIAVGFFGLVLYMSWMS